MLIPTATKLLLNRGFSSQSKDLWRARISGTLQAIGGFTVALATTPAGLISGVVISGLAFGYAVFVRSLMNSMMKHDIATLYPMISLLEILGILIANPLLSALFRQGLHLGGNWIGLHFIMAGLLLYTVALCIIAWIRVDNDIDCDANDEDRTDADLPTTTEEGREDLPK
jgi:hypothetical protein